MFPVVSFLSLTYSEDEKAIMYYNIILAYTHT